MNSTTPFLRLALIGWLVSHAFCLPGQETERYYLSGRDKDTAVPWQFMCTSGTQSGYWTNLVVPSHWDMHGFGTLTYKKDATNAWDERGIYRCEFVSQKEWEGKRVFLVFEGVMTDTTAKLNGHLLGPTHQGGFYRFKYEVTPWLMPAGQNTLEVEVARHSANESVNKAERLADYWVFAGIYRPVYLQIVPEEFIERVAIDAKDDGTFMMNVYGNSDLRVVTDVSVTAPLTVEAQIRTLEGEPVGESFSAPAGVSKTTLHTSVSSPKQWSAEMPNLYEVEVRLKRGDETLHTHRQRFGFRTVEVREGDGIYVNGKKVILKGVNRHSFWPDSGRCLSEDVHRLDIETMKDMNMNAVRMSHYPPDVEFLDLCDELGLYVLDELAGWHNHYDDQVGPALVKAMVTRDVNHPSILFWDNGNEGGFNTNLDSLFAEWDLQQRPVLHPWAPFSGINTGHYLAYDTAQVAASGVPMYYQPKPNDEVVNTNLPNNWIYMPTEFLHGLYDGGAGAGLEDYWTMMMSHSNCAGGFIWVFADEGVKRPDTGEIDTAGNQAPDGIVGPYRQREGSFNTIKQLWSPIQVTRDEDGAFHIANHYSFLNADHCRFIWEMRRFRTPLEAESGHVTLDSGVLEVSSIAPGASGEIEFKLPVTLDPPDALALRVEDPEGGELWTWVWELPGATQSDSWTSTAAGEIHSKSIVMETDEALRVAAGEMLYEFDKRTGMVSHIQRAKHIFSLTGPRSAVGDSVLKSMVHESVGGQVTITVKYEGALKEVIWKLRSDGWVDCEYRYHADGSLEYFGVAFDYPEDSVKSKRWFGSGSYRVWKNRMGGTTLGVWETDYNNTITGYSLWDYPEFKGCFNGVRWMQLTTDEGLITVVPENPEVFVQVLVPEQPPKNLRGRTSISLPDCGLALLDAIPPIGSKFKPAATTGPQGQLTRGEGSYTGSVRFHFSDLP